MPQMLPLAVRQPGGQATVPFVLMLSTTRPPELLWPQVRPTTAAVAELERQAATGRAAGSQRKGLLGRGKGHRLCEGVGQAAASPTCSPSTSMTVAAAAACQECGMVGAGEPRGYEPAGTNRRGREIVSCVQEMRQWPTAAQLPPAARWAGAATVPSLRSGGAALAVCAQCVSGL